MFKGKGVVAGFLAVVALIGFLAVFAFIALKEVPIANKDYFNAALIALIGFVGTGFGYFLGSSQGSARKTEIIGAEPAAAPPPPPADAGFVKVHLLGLLSVGSLLFFLSGCAALQKETPESIAGKSLLSARSVGIALAREADAQCTKGTLDQMQCTRVAEVYKEFQISWVTAEDLLDLSLQAEAPKDAKQRYLDAEAGFRAVFADLYAVGTEFGLVGGEQ